jgi:hypothetical protein
MPTTPEAAVQLCIDAYQEACEREDARKDFSPESLRRVRQAWRHAMPVLTPDPDAIDAFIACVTHGLIYQVFEAAEASKLLYAAQVAIGSRRTRQEAARAETKSHSKSQTQQPEPKPAAPPSPLPPAEGNLKPTFQQELAPKAQLAAPQVLQPVAPKVLKSKVDALLDQLFAGQLPAEIPPDRVDPTRKAPAVERTPTPSPTAAPNLRRAS